MVLFATSLVIISLLLIFVVPNVVSQFANSNQQLPFLTMAMLGISNFFTSFWFGLLIVFLALIAFIGIRFIGINNFFLYVDKVLLKLPIINKFIIDSNLSRFTNSLSILRSSNVPIIRSLDISANTVSNRILKKDINFASVEVSEGNSLARSLSKSKYIPSLIIEMISSGEASGELENMLIKVSKYLQDRFNHSTKITLNLLEPAVIIFMGGFVSLIVLAILLPLIQLNTFSL
jgi:general secretion pathway protein F